jgi:hypothetical protein
MSTKFDRCSHLVLKALETPYITMQMAADYAGVNRRTVQKWCQQGEEDSFNGIDSEKAAFFHSFKKAQVEPAMKAVAGIKMAGDEGQWQALAWLLERLWPKMFGRNALELQRMEELDSKIDALTNTVATIINPQSQHHAQLTQETNENETD